MSEPRGSSTGGRARDHADMLVDTRWDCPDAGRGLLESALIQPRQRFAYEPLE